MIFRGWKLADTYISLIRTLFFVFRFFFHFEILLLSSDETVPSSLEKSTCFLPTCSLVTTLRNGLLATLSLYDFIIMPSSACAGVYLLEHIEIYTRARARAQAKLKGTRVFLTLIENVTRQNVYVATHASNHIFLKNHLSHSSMKRVQPNTPERFFQSSTRTSRISPNHRKNRSIPLK